MTRSKLAALALVGTVSLAACSSSQSATTESAPSTPAAPATSASPTPAESSAQPSAPTAGEWITLAQYEKNPTEYHAAGDVVLFFNATWCPTCQETVKNLDSKGSPAGLTVVSVDYDSNQDLRQEYGVTVQHTFVVVDESGKAQNKFTGSLTGDEIAKQAA